MICALDVNPSYVFVALSPRWMVTLREANAIAIFAKDAITTIVFTKTVKNFGDDANLKGENLWTLFRM
jgi:hypothetical protein